jgi:hypothetical protein
MLEPKRSAPASYAVARPQVSKMPQRDLNTTFQLCASSAKTDYFIAGKEAHIQNFNNSDTQMIGPQRDLKRTPKSES